MLGTWNDSLVGDLAIRKYATKPSNNLSVIVHVFSASRVVLCNIFSCVALVCSLSQPTLFESVYAQTAYLQCDSYANFGHGA